jgi:P27 family predicted phage terminase small subunit
MRPKTKEEKELQGTFEPSREPIEPVEYGVYERIPTAPANWPVDAQKIWMDRCQDLKQTGYLVKAMMAPLRRYCFAVYQAEEAERALLEEGFTTLETGTKGQSYEVVSKWVMILDNANKTIERFGAKFGFTPVDVHKVPAIKTEKAGKEMSLLK